MGRREEPRKDSSITGALEAPRAEKTCRRDTRKRQRSGFRARQYWAAGAAAGYRAAGNRGELEVVGIGLPGSAVVAVVRLYADGPCSPYPRTCRQCRRQWQTPKTGCTHQSLVARSDRARIDVDRDGRTRSIAVVVANHLPAGKRLPTTSRCQIRRTRPTKANTLISASYWVQPSVTDSERDPGTAEIKHDHVRKRPSFVDRVLGRVPSLMSLSELWSALYVVVLHAGPNYPRWNIRLLDPHLLPRQRVWLPPVLATPSPSR